MNELFRLTMKSVHYNVHTGLQIPIQQYVYLCLGVLTIVMKTKTFTVLVNQRAFLSKYAEKNLKTNSERMASAANYVGFSPKFILFPS